ncbi:MAG: dihydrolipoyl dehydrogenase [Candidatus Omnitrophica bacterium]|nr:dihydrolipoyl dehydrogenase [Candidatus Omnitrophota bacterium]
MEYYDLIVIGAGWGGINASLRAADLGLSVALIEEDLVGGTCLNYGCIPTKYFSFYTKLYHKSKSILKSLSAVDFKELRDKKNILIERLRNNLSSLIRNKNINYINSKATFKSHFEIDIGNSKIGAENIIIATGSQPKELDFLKFDKKRIVSTKEILELERLPSSILVVGAGIIGCEFACLFNLVGVDVTLVEISSHILPQLDSEISQRLTAVFKKRGINIHTSTELSDMNISDYELILVSIGRVPNTVELGLNNTDINIEDGRIVTDEYLQTNVPHIYAIGDCTNRIMLAHLASYQGWQLIDNIIFTQKRKKINPGFLPSCVFTYPEVAWVGITEDEAKDKNLSIKVNRFDFLGLGMSHILEETEGMIKIISDKETQRILGASIIGPLATEIIGILTLAINTQLDLRALRDTIFAHPTVSECITEMLKKG